MSTAGAPPPRREWHDPRWYPADYQRDGLRIDTGQLLRHPVLAWEGQGYEGRERQNEPWRQLAGVVPHAEDLHHFTDSRWIPFEGKPLPDGSNIGIITEEDGTHTVNGSPELRSTFILYRQWLTFLYVDCLLALHSSLDPVTNELTINVLDDRRITQLLAFDFYQQVATIYDEERERVSYLDPVFRQFSPDEGLNWIFLWRRSVINQLYDIMAASNWAAETEAGEELHSMLEEFGNFSYINQVLVAIVYKEACFERRLHLLHVEDEHVVKRIRLVGTWNCAIIGERSLHRLHEKYFENVLTDTRILQQHFRELFSFRQLRDWGYGRPWRKMHLVFDTETRPQFADAVRRVRELVSSTRRATDLFGVVPVEKSSLEDRCSICLEDWLDRDLAIESHCHHYFHAACIVRYWDDEFHYDFRCPLCRASGGRVRDRVRFIAQREDFVPDPAQAAVQAMTVAEADRVLQENPGLRTVHLPLDFQIAIGRQMEVERLRLSLEREDQGLQGLPLP